MRNKGVFYLMSVIIFWSCSRVATEESEGQEIRFQGNIQELQKVDLRARGGFVNDDKVQLYIVERDAEGVKVPSNDDFYQMNSDADGNLNFADGEKHIYPGNPIDIYGFYCKGKGGAPVDLNAMPVAILGVQLTTDAVLESDFLYVKSLEGYRTSDDAIALIFGHQFSKIQFNFRTNTQETIDLTQIANIEILNIVREGTFNIATGDLALGEALDEVQVQAENGASAIILPQQIAGETPLFRFMVNEKEYLYTIPGEGISFTKGKLYKCDILINQYPGAADKDIVITTSIEEWDESEPPITVIFEDGQKAVATLADVSPGVNIQQADLYVSSESAEHEILKIPVINNKLEFIFPREKKGGTVRLDKAHFYTESGEEFDYYFKEKQLSGDNYDQLSLVAPHVGDTWAGGTIFVVGKVTGYDEETNTFQTNVEGMNAYRGRIVASAPLGNKMWCLMNAKGKTSLVGANNRYDGLVNLKTIEAFASSHEESLDAYPAFKACQDLGEGWYYPALNEIRWIALHKAELNLNMEAKDYGYGSSTEKSDKDNVGIATDPTKDFPSTKGSMTVWPTRVY